MGARRAWRGQVRASPEQQANAVAAQQPGVIGEEPARLVGGGRRSEPDDDLPMAELLERGHGPAQRFGPDLVEVAVGGDDASGLVGSRGEQRGLWLGRLVGGAPSRGRLGNMLSGRS
jgi:hypothetical protein